MLRSFNMYPKIMLCSHAAVYHNAIRFECLAFWLPSSFDCVHMAWKVYLLLLNKQKSCIYIEQSGPVTLRLNVRHVLLDCHDNTSSNEAMRLHYLIGSDSHLQKLKGGGPALLASPSTHLLELCWVVQAFGHAKHTPIRTHCRSTPKQSLKILM